MEWVQTTAKTVEEAKELALDQLGVADDDAEFEVLEEPRPGLFGRVRGEARVRARVRPNHPRPKLDRRERRRRPGAGDATATNDEVSEAPAAAASNGEAPAAQAAPSDPTAGRSPAAPPAERHPARGRRRSEPAAPKAGAPEPSVGPVDEVAGESTPNRPGSGTGGESGIERSNGARTGARTEIADAGAGADAEAVGPAAAAFLEGLAAAMGLDAGTTIGGAEPELEVRLEGPDLGLLIGPRGQTLLAVQDLTRTVSQRGITNHGRLHVDVGGYRERRRTALARFTTQVAEQVLSSGVPRALEPMGSADRKVVHDTAATVVGVETHSEGEEPTRRVVISPAP